MPRTKAQPVKKQRVSEEAAALPLDDAALLAHAERVVQQLEANEVQCERTLTLDPDPNPHPSPDH